MKHHLFGKFSRAIEGGVCDQRTVSIEITLWLLLACITMSLSGCGGGIHRAYYYEDDRYDETKSGGVLPVGPGGQVVNATSVVSEEGSPSIISSEEGYSVENEGRELDPPGPEVWKSDVADWDMTGYEVVTEPGGCKPLVLSITAASFRKPNEPRRSCWNLLWDIPAGVLLDALAAYEVAIKITAPFRGTYAYQMMAK